MISYHPSATTPREAASGFRETFRVRDIIANKIWSGIVWHGGRRKAEAFAFSDWAVLDFDSGEMTLREAVNTFQDCIHVIGTTKSHQKDKGGTTCDRFRVAVPWVYRIVDKVTYQYNIATLTRKYPADTQCKDLARLFFPCPEIVSVSTEGYKFDVATPPNGWGEPPPIADPELVGSGVIPGHLARAMARPAPRGKIRLTYWQLGRDLRTYGVPLADAIKAVATSQVGANSTNPDKQGEICGQVTSGWTSR